MKKDDIIWEINADKIKEQIKEGKRVDGRKMDEYREIKILKDFSKNAHGSAIARIGETEVIAGIKMDLAEPYPDTPDEGTISVGAELMPMASPIFEAGPPREDAIELARVVDRGIRESKALDFKQLCITPGEKVWIVFIDLYVANHTGNLFDTSAMAAMSALLNTRIPKIEDDKIVKGEFTGNLVLSRKPILSTFAKINGKVVLDPIIAEEKAMDARFSVATTEDGFLSAFQKGGQGHFTEQEITQCIDIAFAKGKELREKLK